jgi:oligopeptide/dipeptide ABC transporter ATP-binding protein
MEERKTILSVEDLSVSFNTKYGSAQVINRINLSLRQGEKLGLVGESGSGKSVTAKSLMRLLPRDITRVQGKIIMEGVDLLKMSEKEMRNYRGSRLFMIFQEPMVSLNPLFTIENQLRETILAHRKLPREEITRRILEMMRVVGISLPEIRMKQYPFEFSGGMRQRVMIAMALLCNPEILIADEPTTALDVTIQAQIMELLQKINREFGAAIILITHDLGLVAEMVDHVAVMYAGYIVEKAPVRELFARPLHPYTQGLLRAMPRIEDDPEELETIEGNVPSPYALSPGCPFAERCRYAQARCGTTLPPVSRSGRRTLMCWNYTDDSLGAFHEG